MSSIDKRELREAAEKATPGPWEYYPGNTSIEYNVDSMVEDQGSIVYVDSGDFTQKQTDLNGAFIAAANPATVLALLDELERNQQYIKRRDQENEDIALTVGKLRVELEAAENNLIDSECHVAELEEALRDKQALLEASEKRIAELEAELVSQTYKLNELSGNSPVTPDGWISCSERMPNEEDVLVYCSDTKEQMVGFHKGKGLFQFFYMNGVEGVCEPSHWMPLPEPPL